MANHARGGPLGAGRGSFDLIDPERVFSELHLRTGDVFFDLGCGRGQYAITAAEMVGDKGLILAMDLWEDGISSLLQEAAARGLRNIRALVSDISKRTPVEQETVDVCFMATVFHDLVLTKMAEGGLQEVVRVLKPAGLLAVLEFKKVEGPPGPPLASRLAPEEVERIVGQFGLEKEKLVEVGLYNYLLIFSFRGPK